MLIRSKVFSHILTVKVGRPTHISKFQGSNWAKKCSITPKAQSCLGQTVTNLLNTHTSKAGSLLERQVIFMALLHALSVFEVMSVYPIDCYKNAIPRGMPIHELKKVHLQEHFTLMTQDTFGHLKTFLMKVLSLSGGVESDQKCCSSPLSLETQSIRVWIQLKGCVCT